MKIAVVPGEPNNCLYLHDEHNGWEWTVQINVGLPERVPDDYFVASARYELIGFLKRALAELADARKSPQTLKTDQDR